MSLGSAVAFFGSALGSFLFGTPALVLPTRRSSGNRVRGLLPDLEGADLAQSAKSVSGKVGKTATGVQLADGNELAVHTDAGVAKRVL